jgi:hypothetical protein
MAIIRIAGVTRRTSGRHPAHKTEHENQRILHDAIYQSSHEGLRAKLTSQWIGDNGSTTAKSRKGETFEDNLTKAEGPYAKRFAENQAARKRGLPKPPPPSRKSTDGTVVIDMESNVNDVQTSSIHSIDLRHSARS